MTASTAYRNAIDRINAGDLEGYLDFYSADVVFGGVTAAPMDHAGVRAFHETFVEAFGPPRVEVVDMIESGDRVAARIVIHGSHQGDFLGVPATGLPASLAITTLLTVRDGRCVERWSTADMLGLLVQLGAVPAPA